MTPAKMSEAGLRKEGGQQKVPSFANECTGLLEAGRPTATCAALVM
jgi:hypothetical protein